MNKSCKKTTKVGQQPHRTRTSYGEGHLNVDNLVADEGLQEHTNQPHKSVLQILVLNVLTGGNAVGNVQVNKVWAGHPHTHTRVKKP